MKKIYLLIFCASLLASNWANAQCTVDFTTSQDACTGLPTTVNFTYTGADNGGGCQNFLWDFGDGTPTSTAQNPNHNYATAGAKSVVLTVTNPGTFGCGGLCFGGAGTTVTKIVNIQPKPNISFTSTAPQCVNAPIDFTNTSTNAGQDSLEYTWDFGANANPRTSTAQNPKGIVYSSSGTKSVSFQIKNSVGCVNTIVQNITISATPTASFTSTAPQCTGLAVDFTNTGTSAGVTWAWDFGTGATPSTSATQNPTGVKYSTAGSKIVTLTITNSTTNCTNVASQTININQTPTASFTSTAPQCTNTAINFTNTGSTDPTYTYRWDLGSNANPGMSSSENPAGVTYSASGTKAVTFEITTTEGCSNSIVQNITINATPTASFSSTAPKCTSLAVDFTNTGTSAGVTWAWDFGTGATPATSAVQNPTGVTYSSAGSKIVTLTITNSTTNCAVIASQTININQTPTASFNSTAPQCTNTAINFTNTGSTDPTYSYSWDFGPGATPVMSSSENPVGVTYSTSGTKAVTFRITTTDGCSNEVVQNIIINATPTASFTSTAPQCTGAPVDFTNTGTSTGVTWAWDFGSGATPPTSTSQNPTGVIYSTAGSKVVTLTITNSTTSCAVTAVQTININPTPTVSFISTAPQCANKPVDFTNTGSTGSTLTYSWDLGDDATPALSTSENPTGVTYSSSGTKAITFQITTSEGCSNTIVQNITIRTTPVVSFTSTAPQCTSLPVDFTVTGTTTNVSYAWNFGFKASPPTSTAQNAAGIIYTPDATAAGSKIVTLTETDLTSGCAVTATQTININETPTAIFLSNAPQCVNKPVTFQSTGSTGGKWSYSWDFGSGALPKTSASESPLGISYSTGGSKVVTLTVYDGLCTKTVTQNISINALPVANAGKDTIICANTTVRIGTAAIGSNTYSWFPLSTLTFTGGNKAQPTSAPVAPVTEYVVTVTDPLTSCVNQDTINVTMLAPLAADAGIDVIICRYDSIQLGAALVKGQRYVWSPIGGLSDKNSPNPMASPDSTVTYILTVTGSYLTSGVSCPAITDEVKVTVHQLPIANAGADDTITVGSSVKLVATGGVQYSWRPPYGLDNIGINTPIASPDFTTEYIVQVIDIFGCKKRRQCSHHRNKTGTMDSKCLYS